jgi:hypothetical protein
LLNLPVKLSPLHGCVVVRWGSAKVVTIFNALHWGIRMLRHVIPYRQSYATDYSWKSSVKHQEGDATTPARFE